jgi:hypothetical protein
MQPCKLFFSCLFCGVCIGERAFSDLRSVPKAGRRREQVENHGMACVLRSISYVKERLDFFHFLEIMRGWLVPSTGQKIRVQPGWYLPPQKIPPH